VTSAHEKTPRDEDSTLSLKRPQDFPGLVFVPEQRTRKTLFEILVESRGVSGQLVLLGSSWVSNSRFSL
jgi:hypothetical protein